MADELAAVVRPLIGKKGSGLKVARVHYRSRTDRRTVEVVVSLGHDQIVKIGERAGWSELEPPSAAPAEVGGEFLRNVDIILHQANRGPAKARGQTGDRGIIPSVNDKPVPVYFADGVNRLKDRMIRSAKNPLKYTYRVDAWVQREGGEVRSYTVTEVHKATPMKDERSG